MAQTAFDSLLNYAADSKEVFWLENANLPQVEIERLWQLRWNHLTSRISEKHGSSVPSKRSIPRTLSVGGHRPSKRQELVGLPCSCLPILGLTGLPEPINSCP
jgi:hypothetical protein